MTNFSQELLTWFDAVRADLPWRSPVPNDYHVWLSEIMLQQTQIETVIPYYKRFINLYPTIVHLANAPLDAILKHWEGLGYYSRARNLHKTAQVIAHQYQGVFPKTADELQKLPGIGRYTAGAIASIVQGERVAVLDGNVIRVLTRLYDLPDDVTQNAVKNRLWELATELVPAERSGDYNQALMELGQKVCRPRQPDCLNCPLKRRCLAYQAGTQAERPYKPRKAPTPHYDVVAGIVYREDGRFLIAQRPDEGLLGGLWEFPGGKVEAGETFPDALKRELIEELALEVAVGDLFTVVKHAFTHFKITLHAFECQHIGAEPQAIEAQAFTWTTLEEIERFSFGKADRVVIEALRQRPNLLL